MGMTRLATLQRCFPTLILLAAPLRWIGKNRWRVCGAALLMLGIIASPLLWWATQLIGLPDIGDPFDIAAFRRRRSPTIATPSCFTARLPPCSSSQHKTRRNQAPGLTGSLAGRRPPQSSAGGSRRTATALAVYRQGAERPDALDPAVGFDRENWKTMAGLWALRLIVLLEASRLEEQGDMAGAWGWYRAMLRTIHHIGIHGCAPKAQRNPALAQRPPQSVDDMGRRPEDNPRAAPPGPR